MARFDHGDSPKCPDSWQQDRPDPGGQGTGSGAGGTRPPQRQLGRWGREQVSQVCITGRTLCRALPTLMQEKDNMVKER